MEFEGLHVSVFVSYSHQRPKRIEKSRFGFDSTDSIYDSIRFDSIQFDSYKIENQIFLFTVVFVVRVYKNDFACLFRVE